MDCNEVIEKLDAFVDGELTSEARAAIEAHVADCPSCRGAVDALREQHDSLRQTFAQYRQTATVGAEQAIAGLPRREPGRTGVPVWGRMLIAAAAGFLLGVLLFQPWEGDARRRDDERLAARVERILDDYDSTENNERFEDQVKCLGADCAQPLYGFVQSCDSESERGKREAAARILSDVADRRCIPQLIQLLTDNDGEVRFCAATGLRRLTGRKIGFEPAKWRVATAGMCESGYKEWHIWWKQNETRYKSGR